MKKQNGTTHKIDTTGEMARPVKWHAEQIFDPTEQQTSKTGDNKLAHKKKKNEAFVCVGDATLDLERKQVITAYSTRVRVLSYSTKR